jgi:hypothetical protein
VNRRRAWRALAATCALLLPAALAAAEPALEVGATLSPDPLGRDELALLTLSVEASGVGLPRIEPGFLLENLEGAGGPSRSQSTSWINGRSSSRLELTWRLRPVALGRARVHSFRVEIGQEIRSLADLEITVVEQAPPGRRSPRAGSAPADPFSRLFDDDPFGLFPRRRRDEPVVQPKLALRSLVAPATAYVGEQLVWTLALDTQTDISGFRPRSLPEFSGFWAREVELPQPSRPEWIEVEGETFGRVAMLKRALFPLRAGELTIARVPVEVQARMADVEWIGGGLGRRDRPVELVAPPVAVRVRPLPPAPPGFSGVVGAATLTASLEPERLAAGQAATLRLRLTTSGNPGGIEPPLPIPPPGLRGFAPATTNEERLAGGRLESSVEWRYVLLAESAGSFEIPSLEWIYFDPRLERYATAATETLRLTAVAREPARASEEPDPPAPPAPASSAAPAAPARFGLWLAATLAIAALLVALAWWIRRPRSAARQLRQALDEARALPSPREAAKAIEAAWRRLLAERYELGRGTPMAQWPVALGGAGWSARQTQELQQLFEEIHLLEFAPELADAEALRHDVDRRSRALARRLP